MSDISTPQHRLRLAAVNFLNPAPLMWDLEHEPNASRLAQTFQIDRMTPALCAEELAQGRAGLGLIPIAAWAVLPHLKIVRGAAIAAKGPIRSLVLAVKKGLPLDQVTRVAADTSSRSTVAHTRILFKKWWNPDTEFLAHEPNLTAMLRAADAAVLIGDPALLAVEDPSPYIDFYDLASEWQKLTGHAWVSAIWAADPQAVSHAGLTAKQLEETLVHSRDNGLQHIEELVQEWQPRLSISAQTIRTYLTHNIHYVLDEECQAAMRAFFQLAEETGVQGPARELDFL